MTIRMLVLDVDGVMTDGSIVLDGRGGEQKRFHVRDGFGIRLWKRMGGDVAIITGRSGDVVPQRAQELGIEHLYLGSPDKVADLRDLSARTEIPLDAMAFVGDDWPDLGAMKAVGYPIAPADAEPRVKAIARHVTNRNGGHGAVRDAVEHLLGLSNLMEAASGLYD
ncbi:MAG: HAD hydrolase family protein [Phycisphaerales bacterium]|nr:HAD hydrolase family protein [Phycisphaerales bacterium]